MSDKFQMIVLDYRCRRCGAPFTRELETEIDGEAFGLGHIRMTELGEHERRFHHCAGTDGGVGIGELIGFHEQ